MVCQSAGTRRRTQPDYTACRVSLAEYALWPRICADWRFRRQRCRELPWASFAACAAPRKKPRRHGAGGGRLHGILDAFLVVLPVGLRGRGGGRFGSGAGGGGRGRLRRGERQGYGGECQGKGQDGRFHFVFSPSRALSPAHNSILRFAGGKLDSLRRLCRPTKSGVSGLMFIRILFSLGWGCARRRHRAILITRCNLGRSLSRISSGS